MAKLLQLGIILALGCTSWVSADVDTENAETSQPIRYFQVGQRYTYMNALLTLVLDESRDKFGPYHLVAIKDMTHRRGRVSLIQGNRVDVMASAANACLFELLKPILIPIERGLLGYRVFLVNEQRADEFSQIKSLKELNQSFTAGFGSGWVDHSILKFNQVPVVDSSYYTSLFKMLAAGRFDYFPRGINEIWLEHEQFSKTFPNLSIERKLAFYYPYPRFFFVNKDDALLAARIEYGLKKIRKNGLFQQLFERYYRSIIVQTKISQRHVFELDNPLLPAGAPKPDTSSWLPPNKLFKRSKEQPIELPPTQPIHTNTLPSTNTPC
jgi:hypothetical protein